MRKGQIRNRIGNLKMSDPEHIKPNPQYGTDTEISVRRYGTDTYME